MSNENRELTLRVKITDRLRADWIWKLHKKQQSDSELGISVHAISDADLFADRDLLEAQLDWLLGYVGSRAAAHLEAELNVGSVKSAPWSHGLLALLRDD